MTNIPDVIDKLKEYEDRIQRASEEMTSANQSAQVGQWMESLLECLDSATQEIERCAAAEKLDSLN